MDFQALAKELKIKDGDFISIVRWVGSNDTSYVGELLKVVAISSPFIRALHMDGYRKGKKITLSLGRVEMVPIGGDFVNDILDAEKKKEAAK